MRGDWGFNRFAWLQSGSLLFIILNENVKPWLLKLIPGHKSFACLYTATSPILVKLTYI